MKRSLLLLGLVLGLCACPADKGPEGPRGAPGPTGAAGPPGMAGPSGPPGSANVKSYQFTIAAADWGGAVGAGNGNEDNSFSPPDSHFEGTSLYHLLNDGASVMAYVRAEGWGNTEEPVPYVHSIGAPGTPGHYVGRITVDYSNGDVIISKLIDGVFKQRIEAPERPTKTHVRLVVTYAPAS